ncbi:ABC transporter permease/M1 family aminopeptidase [Arundinibacter roseus]|uniref:ABC transporter permease n=1 Tax=Arundinibacter roseus TaxID=2070510 RepID=A0A4R4JXF0_9BACT|nr:hypothetical protein [Arundinibacter roseus]TDB59547.1 hypothetical protein EZE20_22360 [Arundinibacter roseus]
MILWKIFRYELVYLKGRISTWLYLATLLAFTILMNVVTTPGDGVYPNNTFHITAITVIGGLIWLVIGAAVAGQAAARDVQMRMHPLIYSTPVRKLDYLGGRFLAAFVLNAGLVLALPAGLLLSFYVPGMNQEELQPFRPLVYLSVYSLISLPTVFVATAIQFSFAALSRQVHSGYLASLLLAVFPQLIALAVVKLPGNWDLLKVLDPIGVAGIVGSELQTWTPTQKNTRLISLEGIFLWNRLLWVAVAVGSLWLTYHRFSFAQPVSSRWGSGFKKCPNVQDKIAAQTPPFASKVNFIPQTQRNFGTETHIHQTLMIARASFATLARHPLGLTLVGAMALGSALFGSKIMNELGIPLHPTTQQVLGYLTAPVSSINTPWVVIPLLMMYLTGLLVWQERDAGLSDLADAAPIPEWALFTGKFLGLGLLLFFWMALLMTGGIGMQLGLGYQKLEIPLYVKTLFGIQLVDYLLFTMLVYVVQLLVNQKEIGYLVGVLAFCFMAFPSHFGIEHPMLIFGADPGWWYTDMRGFGQTPGPWLWFKVYWLAWAFLLAIVARLLWPRGREQSLKNRLRFAKYRFRGSTGRLAILGGGLLLTVGSFIFYNTNLLNEYLSSSDNMERKAEYERRYGRYLHRPQPQLTATRLHVELYPEWQQAQIRATYTLVNKGSVSIDSIHIGGAVGIAFSEVKFNRPAVAVLIDKKLNHHIYALEQPLRPADSLHVNFVVRYKEQGFRPRGIEALVVDNGTYFTNYDLLPTIGYQRYREINDAVLRKKYQLTKRPSLPSLDDQDARKRPFITDQTTFEAIIGTAKDEVAIAPGKLHQSWSKGNRRYFHYKTDASIGSEYSILSGKYQVRESKYKGVAIRIYHHPSHAHHIEKILQSAVASLGYYTEQFGAYPYEYLTIAERAGLGGGATADAGIIYYGEQYSLMNPDQRPGGFDLPYYIMVHEMAHQWWGMARLTPAYLEGAGVLIEGLAVYSGMQVLEKNYGDGHLRQYVNFLHSSYEMPRSLASASLLRANEDFLYYRKGGIAMHALAKYMGKQKVNGALRRLLHKRTSGVLPLPNTLDLYRELQNVTPDSLNYLLDDLFKTNTYWRLKTNHFSSQPTKTGQWLVTMQVQAQKVIVDGTGRQKEVPMNDWLEIGMYEEGKGLNQPIYLQMHRIRSGEQTIRVTLPRKPERGGIDPNHLMIDLRPDDNIR